MKLRNGSRQNLGICRLNWRDQGTGCSFHVSFNELYDLNEGFAGIFDSTWFLV